MLTQDVEQQRHEKRGNKWWYLFAIGLALACLLAVAFFSAPGAGASLAAPASEGGKQSSQGAQTAQPQEQPVFSLPWPSFDITPPLNGPEPALAPTPSAPPGKEPPRGLPDGLWPEWGLPGLGGNSTGTGGSSTGEAPAAPACSPDWVVVSSPNDVFHNTSLLAVDEIAPDDVWAGGYYENDATPPQNLPFFMHWDGASWTAVIAPIPAGGVTGEIIDLSANTSSDVWAVGYYSDGVNTFVLIERWGGIQWNVVPGLNPSPTYNQLLGVDVVSTNNVWAAGYYMVAGLNGTLVEHWDGANWLPVLSPNHGTGGSALQDISVVPGSGGNDIWAVGAYLPTPASQAQTLTLHYDGATWSYVASSNQGSEVNTLFGVYAISANDVWATGGYAIGLTSRTLAEHWNGSSWSIVSTVDPDPSQNLFRRVFATASNDVWAAGFTISSGFVSTLLIEHWNGTAWSVSSNTAFGFGSLTTAIGGGSSQGSRSEAAGSGLWAVGAYIPAAASPTQSLTMRYNGTDWVAIRSPNGPAGLNSLYSVDADSVNDIWAVGFATGTIGGTTVNHGVIEHWNGSSWDFVPSPHPGHDIDTLFGVDVISPDDVWAVGNYRNANNHFQTLIEHWSGTIWSVVSSPNPAGVNHENALYGVAAASPNDVWAVGSYYNGVSTRSLVLHWNGVSWTHVNSPNPGAYSNELQSVAVVPGSGGSDVWAAGQYKNVQADDYSTLFERWDGTSWSVVTSPNLAGADNLISRVFPLSANDAWAAGSTLTGMLYQNLVLHWDGTGWTQSPVLQNGTHSNVLFGVTGTSSNDVYVVGGYRDAISQSHPLVEHWNGSAWSIVPGVTTAGIGSDFTHMVMLSPTNMWAVGNYMPMPLFAVQTLVEHYNPCPTACTTTFSDVPPGSTFYPYIHCMACQGIINGYPDGTFKPNANVTRGQLSKIVANSAGFNDPQTAQMFQDVAVGSTFQVFIGRLASRGYISGYPCGGPGEPCGPGNLPYFRPNNNATRGQISKIVSNAAGFSDAPSGRQFQDVAPASTYYAYIYRLVIRGVMSGYPCGGTGEPCVPPGNLPYFRPNNNATRGQTSKIVGNTFYPNCTFAGAAKR